MHTIDEYKKNGLNVKICPDDNSEYMYQDLWEGVHFISNHRDYRSEGQFKELSEVPDGYTIINVYAYIHGRIGLSATKYSCPFDSGFFGFMVFKDGEFGVDNVGVDGFIEYWTAVLNGDIYYYTIEDDEGDCLSSVGGYTDMEDMRKEIDSEIGHILKDIKEERNIKLKTLIRNRVPLNKREALIA